MTLSRRSTAAMRRKLAAVRRLFSEAGLHARARARRMRLAAGARRTAPRRRRLAALPPRRAPGSRPSRADPAPHRRGGHQGDRGAHQSRRQGGRVLDPRASSGSAARRPRSSSGCISAAPPRTSTISPTRSCCEGARAVRAAAARSTPLRAIARRARASATRRWPCWRARTGRRPRPPPSGKELANVAARLRAPARRRSRASPSSAR